MGKACVFILMTQSVDEGFLVGGRIDAKFLRLDFCGDTLAITGSVDGFRRKDD